MDGESDADNGWQVPLPESTYELVGQGGAEWLLLNALKNGRLPHAWLITGQDGIGKATLAFRFARFLLRHGGDAKFISSATDLHVAADDRISRQISAGAAPDLLVLRRDRDPKTGTEKRDISAESARRLPDFFSLTAGAGGWRVAIIDSADDLNTHSANALLKIIEEPPARAVILIVASTPGRVLATIRSRCRKLCLMPLSDTVIGERLAAFGAPLDAEDLVLLLRLARGSLGRAIDLKLSRGLEQYRALIDVLQSLPLPNEMAAQRFLAKTLKGDEALEFSRVERLMTGAAEDAARAAIGYSAGGSTVVRDLALKAPASQWAHLASVLQGLFARAHGLNLDHRAVTLEALRQFSDTARGTVRGAA